MTGQTEPRRTSPEGLGNADDSMSATTVMFPGEY